MKNLFLTGLLGLGIFCSCSNEDDPANNGKLNEGETYAQIVLNLTDSKAATKAPTGDTGSTDAGTPSEQAVKDLTVVLADANNYVQAIYATTLKTGGTNAANRATEPFPIPAGEYKVYVLANYNEQTKGAFSQTLAVGAQMDQVLTIADASKLHVADNFLMANDDLVAKPTDFTKPASDTEVDDDLAEETDNPQTVHKVSVNIERIVAKVELDQNTTSFEVNDENKTKIASATLEGGALINLNRKMYMVREAKTAANKPAGISTWIYPQDPNYNKKLTGAGDEKDWLSANFSNPSATSFTDFTSAPTFYCPENTMQADAQQNGQTTGVVYKVTYKPESTAYTELANGGTSNYDQIFTAILGLGAGTMDADINASIFTTAESDGKTFYAYNDLIFKNKKAAILYKSIAEATGADNAAKATAANTAFTSNKGKSEEELDAIKVYEYTAGVSYYTAWVKHNPSGSNMQQDKFGVVRNHWYVLTVESISGLGYHKPTFEDPKDPDDKAEANIQVAATIKAWTVVKQQVDL